MQNKKHYSITKDKRRYNDDFMLQFNGSTSNRCIQIDRNYNEISYTNDWSISLFCMFYGSGDYAILDCRDSDGNTSSIKGFEIAYLNNQFYFVTGLGTSPIQINYTTPTIYQPNRLYHCVYTFNSVDKKVEHYINSQKVYEFTLRSDFTMTGVNKGVVGLFSYTLRQLIPLNGLLRDIATFNKKLSQQEITYIYQTGVLPQSTHVNCQFHMPLNHIPKISGLDRLMIDVVSNYDYSKVTTVTPNHGIMSGWTDDELGLSNISQIGAFKDFYHKNQYYGIGLRYDGDNPYKFRFTPPPLSTATIPPTFTQGHTVIFKVNATYFNGILRGDIINFDNTSSSGEDNYYYISQAGYPSGSFVVEFRTLNNTRYLLSNLLYYRDYTASLIITCVSRVNGTNDIYINGIKKQGIYIGSSTGYVQPNNTGFIGSTEQSRKIKAIYYVGMFDGVLTDSQIEQYSKNENWLSLNPTFFYTSENNGTHIIDKSGNLGNAAIQNPTYFQQNQKYSDLTGKPPKKYGLSFNGTNQYLSISSFIPSNTKGYTTIIGYKQSGSNINNTLLNKGNLIKEVYVNDTVKQHYYTNTGSFQVTIPNPNIVFTASRVGIINLFDGKKTGSLMVQNSIYDNTTATLSYNNFDTVAGTTYIGTSNTNTEYFEGTICYLAIYKGVLNDKEIKTLYNNGLFSNAWDISPLTKSELVLYPDFNNPYSINGGEFNVNEFSNYFNFTEDLYIPDLSPSNHTIIAHGWNSIADLQNSRVEIKSLY